MHLEPVFISGDDTLRFPDLGYYSHSEAGFVNRRKNFALPTRPNLVCVARKNGENTQDYDASLNIPSSFNDGKLSLIQYVTTCGKRHCDLVSLIPVPQRNSRKQDNPCEEILAKQQLLPLPIAVVSVPLFETNVTFIEPKAEPVKERIASTSIRINYPVAKSVVLREFANNRRELARIDSILKPVLADSSTYRILKIDILGYTSPEGTYAYNLDLSKRRTESMREYLWKNFPEIKAPIQAQGMGEDWNGLVEEIEKEQMPYKKEVLEIIDQFGIFKRREKILMELRGGEPYKFMLKKYFPKLRRMDMIISYRVRHFLPEEVADMINYRSQDLSQNEIFNEAQAKNSDRTILNHRSQYGWEYDIAVRYFPHDDVANINAASAALVRGDLEQAWVCLNRVKDNPLAFNNLGVYHWLCGRADLAEQCFIKALDVDPKRADYNLRQFRKWKESVTINNKNNKENYD